MSNLNVKTLNQSLSEGYTSDPFRKEGKRMTVVAVFNGITGTPSVKLQQSVEGRVFQDIPKSEIVLEPGQGNQMWNESLLPEGTYVRVVVGSDAGELVTIKILS